MSIGKWFLGDHDLDELISTVVRRLESMDLQLGEVKELLEGLPLAIAAELKPEDFG